VDDIDRQLVTTLMADARTSFADLARQVGLSAPSVQERVRKLEREGVDSDDVAAGLRAVPEIEDCWFVAGDEAFVAKVRVADLDHLDRTLRVLRHVPGIARTRTTVVLSTVFEGRRRVPEA
jgi:Lrp/AsnC family leucine-responsive transcriptional regulator